MGLFENLFKPRPDGSVERVVESPLKASGLAERTADADGEAPPDPAAAFLHPKGYAPGTTSTGLGPQNQGFVPVLPARRAPAPERKARPPEDPAGGANMVILTVGDVLPRIPVSFLRPGPRDLKRELHFHIDDLASDITRGRPAIALSCIAEQCPELFHSQIGEAEDMAIRLPLQKLVEQVGRIRSHVPPAALHLGHPPVRPPTAAPVEKPKPAVPPPAPVPPPAEKIVAVAPPPVIVPAPVAPVPPPPAPVPAVAVETPVLPVSPVVIAPPAPVPGPEVVAPIAPEPPRAQEPEPSAEQPPVIPDEPAPVPSPPPVRSAERVPSGSVIDLSLAAIVAKVPREMVAGPLPHIDESYRISLPFPMIERQLGTGAVAIPAKLFWSALPPLFRRHFIVREDLTVPLPLEEIFQNLPFGGGGEKPRFEPFAPASFLAPGVETPIVLAPALPDHATPEFDLDLSPPPAAPIAEKKPVPEPPLPAAEVVPLPIPQVAEPAQPAEPAAVAIEAEPVPAPAPEPPSALPLVAPPEEIVLAASVPAETVAASAASATPADEQPSVVNLQPFRIFHPPSPSMESETALAAAMPADTAHILRPATEASAAQDDGTTLPGAEEAEEAGAMPRPVPAPLDPEPPEAPAPQFSVLPSPVPEPEPVPPPAALPPEPEPLVAFTPDQPPPLKIEAPAAAVAVLHATVAPSQEIPAVAMATGSVQPPRMFRPVVLPPPISGTFAAAPNLAPTLAGPGSTEGMISLSPAVEARSPAPFAPVSVPAAPPRPLAPEPPPPPVAEIAPPPPPPAAPAETPPTPPPEARDEPAPTLKNLVRRLFTAPSAQGEAATASTAPLPDAVPKRAETISIAPPPPAPTPPAALSQPAPPATAPAPPATVPPAPDAAPFHLHLPPLPQSAPAPSPPAEHTPPALPISRFDQHSLQSLFMTEETLDLPKVSRLAAALPGLQGCVIVARGETFTSGLLPAGFHLNALRGLSPQVGAAADRLPIGELKNFTLYGEQYSISFFERPAVCLCAIHRARSFVPGVREKLVAVVDELARG